MANKIWWPPSAILAIFGKNNAGPMRMESGKHIARRSRPGLSAAVEPLPNQKQIQNGRATSSALAL
jgi:hypothetical protein